MVNNKAFLFYVLAFLSTTIALEEECPHPEESYPCYCEDEEVGSVMHCNYLHENTQLSKALHRLTDYKIATLSIWMFDEGTIKSDAFNGPKINEIIFTHSQLFLESPPFLGQETSLNRLTFINSFDEEDLIGSLSLGHLKKLKDITFEKNVIKVLKNNWLTSSGDSLRSITFDECKIETLDDEVFSKISTLTTLFVMNNQISSVSRSMFPKDAHDLRSINLSGNMIKSLPEDFFKDMPSLMSIDLERNQFKTLDESAWMPKLEKMSRVYLEDNPIRCDKALKWISKIALPRAFTGKCREPLHLKGREIRTMTPAEFH